MTSIGTSQLNESGSVRPAAAIAHQRETVTWALCVATYNRLEALLRCVQHALEQTRLPREIIIVDSSDMWQSHRDQISELVNSNRLVELKYIFSEIRSSTVQRNIGIEAASADILFMIDDDSFMYPDCAEAVIDVYEADGNGSVAGVCAAFAADPPIPKTAVPTGAASLERKVSIRHRIRGTTNILRRSRLARWFLARVLFESRDALFIFYEDRQLPPVPSTCAHLPVRTVMTMPGSNMTVRRKIALREPFDPALRFYAAFEDLDATYRYGRHGALLVANQARLHHFEARSGRMPPDVVIAFQLLNMLVFIRRHSQDYQTNIRKYTTMLYRRLLAETIKDLIASRWRLPNAAGVIFAIRHWREVAAVAPDRLDEWYPAYQRGILEARR